MPEPVAATNLTLGPVQVFDNSSASINVALLELVQRIDHLRGLTGRTLTYNRLRADDPIELDDVVTLGSLSSLPVVDPSNPYAWLARFGIEGLPALELADLLALLLPYILLLGGSMDTLSGYASQEQRVVPLADATSITPPGGTARITLCTHVNTQALGTLTVNAPTGQMQHGDIIDLELTTANVQTYAFNAIYVGSTALALPTTSSGAGLRDFLGFRYSSLSTKWHLLATNAGFV